MADYPADPGGIFDSNVHRRVLAVAGLPDGDPEAATLNLPEVVARLDRDPHCPLGTLQEEAILAVLSELKKDGYLADQPGYQMTAKGFKKLTGPPAKGI